MGHLQEGRLLAYRARQDRPGPTRPQARLVAAAPRLTGGYGATYGGLWGDLRGVMGKGGRSLTIKRLQKEPKAVRRNQKPSKIDGQISRFFLDITRGAGSYQTPAPA